MNHIKGRRVPTWRTHWIWTGVRTVALAAPAACLIVLWSTYAANMGDKTWTIDANKYGEYWPELVFLTLGLVSWPILVGDLVRYEQRRRYG